MGPWVATVPGLGVFGSDIEGAFRSPIPCQERRQSESKTNRILPNTAQWHQVENNPCTFYFVRWHQKCCGILVPCGSTSLRLGQRSKCTSRNSRGPRLVSRVSGKREVARTSYHLPPHHTGHSSVHQDHDVSIYRTPEKFERTQHCCARPGEDRSRTTFLKCTLSMVYSCLRLQSFL